MDTREINLVWEVSPPLLGKSWATTQDLIFYEVMPDGTRERVRVTVTQERVQ